jgi:uncharacterized membrane protein YoaK (UPF0700 family)/anti-anti-sigma regulatory factor
MLSASAYSFRQKSRLAISLSWVAGYTNVITFIVCAVVTSHATGNVTHFGKALVDRLDGRGAPGAGGEALYFGGLVASFFLGAVVSGCMTEGARRVGFRSKYMLPIALEALLLCFLCVALDVYRAGGTAAMYYAITGVASFAMGLQNATITRVSGAVVRTTHLTGVVTDMGLEGVQYALWLWDKTRSARPGRRGRVLRVSQRHPSVLRLLLLASIVGSFLFGVVAGTFAWHRLPQYAMVVPVGFLLWMLVADWRKPVADVRELDLLRDPDHRGYADLRAVLPPELGIYRLVHHRHNAAHHAPDFQHWAERIPRHWRVVVLAVSPLTHFDADAALDLLAAVHRLRAQHRDLVFCGVNRAQFKAMRDAGLEDVLGMENFCPDLDLAIARALNRVDELTGARPARGMVARQLSA